MSVLRRGLGWLPPFLLGAVGATSSMLTGALLLYTGTGFLPSLTAILATELVGLGLGVASSASLRAGDVDAVRRRWLLALLAYASAAGFSAAWTLGRGFSAAPWAQGLGLGLLGGFPLFAVGSALGSLRAAGDEVGSGGAAASLGAAAGVAATGLVGMPGFEPPSVFLFCVVAVSVAALVHGWQVDARLLSAVLYEVPGGDGGPGVRLEKRFRSGSGEGATLLTVAERPAAGLQDDGGPLLPWERAAAGLVEALGGRGRILLVGARGGGLHRALVALSERDVLVTFEPWERLRGLPWPAVGEGAPEDSARESGGVEGQPAGPFRVVVVALRLLPEGAPRPGRGMATLEAAAAAREPGGLLLLGGLETEDDDGGWKALSWIGARSWGPEELHLLRPRSGGGKAARFLRDNEGEGGGLIVGGTWPETGGDGAAWEEEMEISARWGGAAPRVGPDPSTAGEGAGRP